MPPKKKSSSANKVQASKSKEMPTYIYTHICTECTGFIKETKSHLFQAETSGRGFCEKCGKEVETKIVWTEVISPDPIYSKDNPYGV